MESRKDITAALINSRLSVWCEGTPRLPRSERWKAHWPMLQEARFLHMYRGCNVPEYVGTLSRWLRLPEVREREGSDEGDFLALHGYPPKKTEGLLTKFVDSMKLAEDPETVPRSFIYEYGPLRGSTMDYWMERWETRKECSRCASCSEA